MKKTEKTATLFVFKNKDGEVFLATFDNKCAETIKQSTGVDPENHEAKSATTRGMYGKLFGLTGIQKKAGAAFAASLSKKALKEKMAKMLRTRWDNARKAGKKAKSK